MAQTMRITALAAADQADWARLWRGYLDFYGATIGGDVYATTFQRMLSGAEGEFRGLIARDAESGAALGLTHFLAHRHCWSVANVVYLQDLFVTPAARGRGVGRALIEAVYGAADAMGAANVYWLTQSGNATARALYDQVAKPTDFMKYARR